MIRRTGILLTLVALTWTAAVCGVPERGSLLPGIDEDSMRVRLAESDLQPLEGIWYYPNEQLTLGIERWRGDDNIQYRIILLDCDDAETLPGMIMGYIAPTAVPTKYQMWLFSERDRLTLLKPLNCVATLSSSGTSLTFDPPHWRVKVRVNRDVEEPIFAYTIKNKLGIELTGTNTMFEGCKVGKCRAGETYVVSFTQQLHLRGGEYLLSIGCTGFGAGELLVYHRLYDVCSFLAVTSKDAVGYFDPDSQVVIEAANA